MLQAGAAWPELPWPAGHAAETAAGGGVYTSPVSVTDQTATELPVAFRADLMPALSIPVYAGQAGIVVRIAVHPGDRVAAGDTLARLDDRLPRLEYEAAALVLAQAQARLARFRLAWHRRLISAQEFEQGEYQARLAELRCTEATLALGRTVLVAPAAGVIGEYTLLRGQPVAAGQECFQVEDPTDLSAELAVPVALLVGTGTATDQGGTSTRHADKAAGASMNQGGAFLGQPAAAGGALLHHPPAPSAPARTSWPSLREGSSCTTPPSVPPAGRSLAGRHAAALAADRSRPSA